MQEDEHMRVTMALTEQDVENVSLIRKNFPGLRNKTHAVSTAVAFFRFIIEAIAKNPGTELILRYKDGRQERIVMPGMESLKEWRELVREPAMSEN
jgi:hypothetical protein